MTSQHSPVAWCQALRRKRRLPEFQADHALID